MPSAICYFLHVFGFLGKQYQTESKQRKTVGLFFSVPEETLEASGEDRRKHEGATSLGGAPPRLVGPSWHLLT